MGPIPGGSVLRLERLPTQAQIDGLKDSLFDHVSFSDGAANPWQIAGSIGLDVYECAANTTVEP